MSAQRATAEKSMEEILASIRQTIEQDVEKKQRGGFMSEQNTVQQGDDVFELTQAINEDGSVSDVEEQSTAQNSETSLESSDTTAEEIQGQVDSETQQDQDESSFLDAVTSAENEEEETVLTDVMSDSDVGSSSAPKVQTTDGALDQIQATTTSDAGTDTQWQASEVDATLISDTVAQVAGQALSELSKAVSTPSSSADGSAQKSTSAPTAENLGQNTVEGLMRELLRPMLKDWLDAHLPSLVKWIVTEQIEKIIQEKKKGI